jgi:hypothetical protein
MRRFSTRFLVTTALLLTACGGGADPTVQPTATAVASAAASASASLEPSPEPTPIASSGPSASLPPPASDGEFAVTPDPAADALFLARDECQNLQDGYQLQFPDEWYTNTEIRDVPACSWFSPDFYTVDDFDEIPDEIAITIEWSAADSASFEELISTEVGIVGGQPAVRAEWAGAQGNGGQMPAEWRMYRYQIQLGPTPEEGPNILVTTTTDMGGDYELNKAIIDRMMATIEFVGSVQLP